MVISEVSDAEIMFLLYFDVSLQDDVHTIFCLVNKTSINYFHRLLKKYLN